MLRETQFRIVVIAAGITICIAYLAGGARSIGAGARDVVFSPAMAPAAQLTATAADVAVGARSTPSSVVARGSIAIAKGRRSAVRDFAAVSAAAAAIAFAALLHAARLPAFAVIATMLGIAFGDTFWWRGTNYTASALFPLLFLTALWAALRWQASRRRWAAGLAIVCGILAIVDFVRPLAGATTAMAAAPGFLSSLTREFTPLGLLLAGIGLIVLLRAPSTRAQAAVMAVVLLLWHWLWRSPLDPVNVMIVIAGWWAVAIALSWLHSITPERSRPLLIGAIAVILIAAPVLTRARLAALGADAASERRVRIANDFPAAHAPDGAIVIAESRRADTALLLSSRLAKRPISLVPQSVDQVAEASTSGRPVIAFEHARANLEPYGFLFEPDVIGNVTVARVVGRAPCVSLDSETWQDVSLLLANGSVVVHGSNAAAPSGVVIRMAAPSPMAIAAIDPRSTGFEIGDVAADAEGVPQLLAMPGSKDQGLRLTSLRIPASGRVAPVIVAFASPPAFAVATAEDPIATSLCPGPQRGGTMLGSAVNASVRMNDNIPFGPGWHPVEADPDLFRWTAAPDAVLRIAVSRPGTVRVTITATPASRPTQKPTIALRVNDCRLETHAMHAGQGDYEWRVEERCWKPGMNQLSIQTSPLISPASLFSTHDTRLLGARIGAVRLARTN